MKLADEITLFVLLYGSIEMVNYFFMLKRSVLVVPTALCVHPKNRFFLGDDNLGTVGRRLFIHA